MYLDIKAGVLTLISPLMKMNPLYFSLFVYKLYSFYVLLISFLLYCLLYGDPYPVPHTIYSL